MEHWRKLPPMAFVVLLLVLPMFASFSSSSASLRSFHKSDEYSLMNWKPLLADEGAPAVKLTQGDQHVTVDNGLFAVTFSVPEGMINIIQYKGISNMLSEKADTNARMYFDAVWEGGQGFKILASSYNVTVQTEDQVELSFSYTWDLKNSSKLPMNVDKRYVVLRGISGIYIYGVYERLEGWPDLNFVQTRIVFRPDVDKFTYLALTDERQRVMPSAEDRENGKILDYKEAVKLINTSNPDLQGEVDDKYQYSAEYKDSRVHGWISEDQGVGIWMITPSNEFKNGGPTRQRMHSHVGPTMLNVLTCTHYAGPNLEIKFRNGEPWKKVFGPVLVYLNSGNRASAWNDAKNQMLAEVGKWPYDFPSSKDYLKPSERGTLSGVLRVHDAFVQNGSVIGACKAQVGLAAPGEAGSWQRESKGYQFWVEADDQGNFVINNILPGTYNIYAFVPGVIGDYAYDNTVTVAAGDNIRFGVLTYEPPRDGPTLWEIGVPDRSAAEFYIPDPDPELRNYLYDTLRDQKFRQYGLWRRYAELHPTEDITYTINENNYSTDWFFAQVTRKTEEGTYVPTTWKVNFTLEDVKNASIYTLRIALASIHATELQVRVNDPNADPPLLKTGQIGKENAIARHGVHGLYWLFNVDVPGEKLIKGNNTIFLTQSIGITPYQGIMYDYIRFEGPTSRMFLRKKQLKYKYT